MNRVSLSLILIVCSMLCMPSPCWAENEEGIARDKEELDGIFSDIECEHHCEQKNFKELKTPQK